MRASLLAFAVLGLCPAAFSQSGSFAITGVKVFLGDGRSMESANIVIQDGKIISVSTDPVAGSITTIDGKGKVLYPGFIDAYSTRLTKSAPEPKQEGKPDLGSTAPPYMWIGNRKGIFSDFGAADNLDLEKDSSSYENGITTTLLSPNKGSIRGSAAVINLLPSTDKGRVLNPVAGFGISFRNGAGDGYPSNILGVVALMRQVLADAKSLAEGAQLSTAKDKPTWIKALEDLSPLVTGKKPGIVEANMDREIDRSLKLGEEFGFQVMLAGGRDAYKMTDLLKSRNVPVLWTVDNLIEPNVEPDKPTVAAADVTPTEVKVERHVRWEEQMAGPKALATSGVKFAFSSGSSPGSYLENIRKLEKFGVDKDLALKAMTIYPAEILGVSDRVGSIEAGKLANLVLMSGEFMNKDSKVERVWVAGTAVVEPKKEVAK